MKNCKTCSIEKTDKRFYYCRSCAAILKFEKVYKDEDYIIVEHKTGNRGTGKQRVYKFRSICPNCQKDRGYVFKQYINKPCGSCSTKESSIKGKKVICKQGIRSYHNTPFQGMVCVRSSFEAFYIEYLNSNNIKYLYEPKRFIFKNRTTYTPDFYLIEDDIYIELKGFYTKEYKIKKRKIKKEYPNINIKELKLKDLNKMGYKTSKYLKSFKVTINEEPWTVYLEKNFDKKFGKNDCAVTEIETKKIFFRLNDITIETILHELYHAYYSYMNLGSVRNLKNDDLEEIHCEFVSKNLYKIFYQTFNIYKRLIYIASNRYRKDIDFSFYGEEFKEEQVKALINAFKFQYKSKHQIFDKKMEKSLTYILKKDNMFKGVNFNETQQKVRRNSKKIRRTSKILRRPSK